MLNADRADAEPMLNTAALLALAQLLRTEK